MLDAGAEEGFAEVAGLLVLGTDVVVVGAGEEQPERTDINNNTMIQIPASETTNALLPMVIFLLHTV